MNDNTILFIKGAFKFSFNSSLKPSSLPMTPRCKAVSSQEDNAVLRQTLKSKIDGTKIISSGNILKILVIFPRNAPDTNSPIVEIIVASNVSLKIRETSGFTGITVGILHLYFTS